MGNTKHRMGGLELSHYDETAERSILGAALMDARITAQVKLTREDFAHALHGALWAAISKTHADGHTPDLSTLLPNISGVNPSAVAPLLVDLVGQGIVSNAEAYAATIRDRAERRRIEATLDGIRQRLDQPDTPAEDVLAYAETSLLAGNTSMDVAAETLYTLDEFLDRDLPPIEWVIPDLLATGERFVLTGVEGFGKSVLMRQIGVCVASGINPFSLQSIPRKKVLVVDCENPERIMMAKLGDLRSVLRRRGVRETSLYLKRYPQGLDLADPKDRLDLHHLLAITRPDLLLIGPAYKLYVGGAASREEDLARLVTATLDGLREEFGFSLVLEHHSPHGNSEGRAIRPIGSSLWLRWPEFGMGLRPATGSHIAERRGELSPWRGARDERPWPKQLSPGLAGELPWVASDGFHPQREAS